MLYELSHISHTIENKPILNNLNLSILSGDCINISGDSGCGKSLLFSIMSGIFMPNNGDVLINGQSIKQMHYQQLIHFRKQLGDILLAINQLQILQKSYANNIEKQIYYNTVSWVYQSQDVKATTMIANINILDTLLKENNLNNIEIYSYVIYQYAKKLAHTGNSQAEKMIFKAINHFSNLELPNRISACYQLAAHYYEMVGNKEKAIYYQQQTKIIH